MQQPNVHPALAAFDSLLALRTYSAQNRTDSAALFARVCAEHVNVSHSQLFQDALVLLLLRGKRNGFFVDFGATDGVSLNNTYLLETRFQWKGILAEPARCWHERLKKNRTALVDTRCVWSKSDESLSFFETSVAELSTVSEFRERDYHKGDRQQGTSYDVRTVSLNDLLAGHGAPKMIDYLSVDTEGSEFDILNAFEFQAYDVKIITVEHNFSEPGRQQIFDLLTARNFVRILEPFSKFDDWYVQKSVLADLSK